MIVPSIDLMNGKAVQLVGGDADAKQLERDDPDAIARQFAIAGDVAVIDLDAALRQGDNAELIGELLPIARCRVGGGIRDVDTAIRWLDAGAHTVILGTAAKPEVLEQLPRDRVMAALDARRGEVVVDGWRTGTGESIEKRLSELREVCDRFLITFVEREGRMEGIDLPAVERLVEASRGAKLTVAGGITTAEEIAHLDAIGVDAQVGMAIYTGALHLADAITAPMTSDRADGLWPTVVTEERGAALGLCYSNRASVRAAVEAQQGVYHSRSRGLWHKGKTSGNTQDLLRIDLDCDRDAMRFIVRQHGGGFCHLDQPTCFGHAWGLDALHNTLAQRVDDAPAGSYTRRLLDDADLLGEKLREEARELCEAREHDHIVWEAADVLYFLSVKLAAAGASMADVERELDRRALAVTRRSQVESKGQVPST